MYVDASELCNDLAFTLGPSTSEELARAGLATAATRTWNIKVIIDRYHQENLDRFLVSYITIMYDISVLM